MKVVVCVKQIPDPADPVRSIPRARRSFGMRSSSWTSRIPTGSRWLCSLSTLPVKAKFTVSMAPNNEVAGLRTALAMGAASATVVSDDALQGSDALGTAKVLAAAIARQEPDLVLAATESSDGYTGTVPEQVAALMDLPSVTFAKSVAIENGTAKVQRQTEAGYDDVERPLLALASDRHGRAPLPVLHASWRPSPSQRRPRSR